MALTTDRDPMTVTPPDKPWRTMYLGLLRRTTELIEDGEGWTGIEHPSLTELRRLVAFHNELWEDGQPTTTAPASRRIPVEAVAAALGVTPEHVYREYLGTRE